MSDRRPDDEIAGRYVIEREIGRGGMGAVYVARDTRLGRRVALKTLAQDTSVAHRQRLEAEARAVASIEHPGIVTLFDVVEDAGETVLVMELVDGDSLRSIMNDRALSPDEVANVVFEVSEALAAAHAKGLVHRDVKPDNIMVRRDGRVALLDFGVAKSMSGEVDPTLGTTRPGAIVGTPSYLSPEQARGASVGPASDQFALAVTAYEMLTRSLPWETKTPMLTIASIVSSDPKPLEGFDASVSDVLARGLAKAPEARFADVRELAAALCTALGVPPTQRRSIVIAPRDPSGPRVPSPIGTDKTLLASETPAPTLSRSRRTPTIAAVLALALACGVALFIIRRHRHAPTPTSTTLAIADVPADGTTDAHARATFRDAMRAMSNGRGDAPVIAFLDEAIRADPEFASAELQRAVVSFRRSGALDAGGRHAYLSALEHQTKLGARDAELLRALGPSFTDPPDWRESGKRLEAMLAERPGDAEAWEALGILRFKQSDLDAAEEALRREQTVDPSAYTSYFLRGHLRVNRADIAGARRFFSECIEHVPATIQCRGALVWIDRMGGDCATADHVAREMVTLAPDLSLGYAHRAETAAALGAPSDALRELLAQKREHAAVKSPAERADDDSSIALREGDFTAALAFLDAADAAANESETTEQRGARVLGRTNILREIGDTKKAGAVAMAYLDRTMARALPEQPWQDHNGALLSVAFEGGRLSQSDYVRRRDDWVQSWRTRLDPAGWQHDGLVVWIGAYLNLTPTRERAQEALLALPSFGAHNLDRNDTSVHEHEPEMGAVLLAAGRVDEAAVHLESATRWCRLVPFVPAWRSLGEARLSRGDSKGACDAFAKVEQLWGRAKPASITRDRARADGKRAGCTF